MEMLSTVFAVANVALTYILDVPGEAEKLLTWIKEETVKRGGEDSASTADELREDLERTAEMCHRLSHAAERQASDVIEVRVWRI